jgi:hypothetical protein
MIEVQVEEIEAESVAIDQPRPRADARDGVAPGFRGRDLGRVGKPERAGVGDAKAVLLEQNRREFSFLPRIVAADPNGRVAI